MLPVAIIGAADVELSFYSHALTNHQRKNHKTFLRRNVRRSLRFLIMGSAVSSLKDSLGLQAQEEPMELEVEDDDENMRPAKRRRMNEDEVGARRPFGHVTNESSRGPSRSKPELIKPTSFYGKSQSTTPIPAARLTRSGKSGKKSIRNFLPEAPAEFAEAMKVEIKEINTECDEQLNREPGVYNIRCICRVAIFYAKNDENPGEVKNQDYQEICRFVKSCTLRTTVGEDRAITRKIILPEPFVFQPDHFYVNRRSRNFNGHCRPGFADKYSLQVFLDPKGHCPSWPPLKYLTGKDEDPIRDMIDDGTAMLEDLSLYCHTNPWFGQERHDNVPLQICHKNSRQQIPYSLKLKVNWTLPIESRHLAKSPKSDAGTKKEPIEPAEPEKPAEHLAVFDNGILPVSPLPRRVGEPAIQYSPDRAARRRANVPTYNLKKLSTIAQGRSPRAPRTSNPRARSGQRGSDDREVTVTYSFGRADATEVGIKRETIVPGLNCPFCLSCNRSPEELRLHLHNNHSSYKFHLRRPNPPRVAYFIELTKNRPGSTSPGDRKRTFQLGRPATLFDLEQYLGGDETWTKARYGPLHNHWPEHLHRGQGQDSSMSSSPFESRQSSPNTSNDTDEMMDFEHKAVKLPVRHRQVYYVPKTAKPLYCSITKRVLTPGDPLPNSDDEFDESWLHQKQRDNINDFTDIAQIEKDYINKWNPFIVNEHLTSDAYLQDALVRFVEANKMWIAEKVERRQEFMRQAETFTIRGHLDEAHARLCMGLLIAEEKVLAEKEKPDVEMDDGDKATSLARPLLACICGPTLLSNRVTCRGDVSIGSILDRGCSLMTCSRTAQHASTVSPAQRVLEVQSKGNGSVIIVGLDNCLIYCSALTTLLARRSHDGLKESLVYIT